MLKSPDHQLFSTTRTPLLKLQIENMVQASAKQIPKLTKPTKQKRDGKAHTTSPQNVALREIRRFQNVPKLLRALPFPTCEVLVTIKSA